MTGGEKMASKNPFRGFEVTATFAESSNFSLEKGLHLYS